ncbi:MAG TPA: transposase [Terriglobales bacterium]|jgi:putative transposase|nr:transposase [Terriglobales bacterium]
MPWGLKRYQDTGDLHFITFSCYQRQPFLSTPNACRVFEETLEDVRRWYGLYVKGYVVMPEHVHLLVSEPERSSLRVALQMLKQIVSQKLKPKLLASSGMGTGTGAPSSSLQREDGPNARPKRFWQVRYYDFNVRTRKKQIEKLRYIHRNPVHRGLVEKPEDWPWSSFLHYATGVEGVVEIESECTGRKRERMGMPLQLTVTGRPVTFGDDKQTALGTRTRS